MFRYFRALDPARSLATAFAWFTVALSLMIALALVSVGDYAANSMLAQRDTLMKRYAAQFAAGLEATLAGQPRAPGAAPVLPRPDQLAALASAARERAKPDTNARVVLINDQD